MLKQRSFAAFIVFSIITCGIYTLYFYYTTTQDLNTISGTGDEECSPALAAFLPIVTCGIYGYFWYYKQGNRIEAMCRERGINVEENGTTYLMWLIFGALLCGIGYFYGVYLFIKNLNFLVNDYNARAYR